MEPQIALVLRVRDDAGREQVVRAVDVVAQPTERHRADLIGDRAEQVGPPRKRRVLLAEAVGEPLAWGRCDHGHPGPSPPGTVLPASGPR